MGIEWFRVTRGLPCRHNLTLRVRAESEEQACARARALEHRGELPVPGDTKGDAVLLEDGYEYEHTVEIGKFESLGVCREDAAPAADIYQMAEDAAIRDALFAIAACIHQDSRVMPSTYCLLGPVQAAVDAIRAARVAIATDKE